MFDGWIHRFAETALKPSFLVLPIVLGFLLAFLVGPRINGATGSARTAPCGATSIENPASIDGGQP